MSRVVVVHPDLGLGGAERLIVDASRALQDCQYKVRIYTGYHDKSRCFKETRDGTLEVHTVGSWIPRTILGRCHALMAYLRMIYIAIYLLFTSKHDVVLCDQVSACIPILKLDFRNKPKIVFYCHFPDQLLTKRDTWLKSIYRIPIDMFEEWSTSLADTILVNSKFTAGIVSGTFKTIEQRDLHVLYPCVDVDGLRKTETNLEECRPEIRHIHAISNDHFVFLSINRFERKKDLGLAIEAFSIVRDRLLNMENPPMPNIHLVMAGGYDPRIEECQTYYSELYDLSKVLNLTPQVTFLLNPSEGEKLQLFHSCHAVIYTPENEHFGIVPLEAMAMSKPVLASDSGGPLETIIMNHTGYLSKHDKESFSDKMMTLCFSRSLAMKLGKNGREEVRRFSYERFRDKLDKLIGTRALAATATEARAHSQARARS